VFIVIIINYFAAKWLSYTTNKKTTMIILVIINILILAFFKYFNAIFPNTSVNLYYVDLFYKVNPINHLIIPIGLSYILFTVLSYLIEIKRKTIKPEKHFGYFSLYILFFPKIAQGPIERPYNLLPQIRHFKTFNYSLALEGIKQMLWGFFKKLVVADRLGTYVNEVYGNYETHNGTTLIVATFLYSFQIYADFSGYTDIALGSAKLFGINLTPNFRRPYFATSIQDFWNRWHISFSTWLRDYLFLPLAYYFSKNLKKENYLSIKADKWIYSFAILITFFIAGIWHGEGLHYILWGLLFGIYLSYSNWTFKWNRKLRKKFHIKQTNVSYKLYKIFLTFLMVSFAWIFFRSNDSQQAFEIIKRIFSFSTISAYIEPSLLIPLLGLLLILYDEFRLEFYSTSVPLLNSRSPVLRYVFYYLIIFSIILFGVWDENQFIYLQF